jgi:acetoin utilization protein AcuB
MRENKFGTLVVVKEGKPVGLITESDLFKAFIDVFGFDRPGVRIIVVFEDAIGSLGKLTSLVSSLGILIISLVFTYDKEGRVHTVLRLQTDDREKVVSELRKNGYEVLN